MSEELKPCPQCECPYGYFLSEELFQCPECQNEWDPNDSGIVVIDSNGNVLKDGDSVIIIKDLNVKGASAPIKAGTKVKNIRLTEDAVHNIDCKLPVFGKLGITSKFVRKA